MEATILGSGTCVPSLERSACAVLVRTGDCRILFDCGPGTMRRLLESGTGIEAITHICLSHFHPDHSGELAPFLFSSKYPAHRGRQRPLTVIGGIGTASFFRRLQDVYGHWIDLGYDRFSIVEMSVTGNDHVALPGAVLATAPVAHNPESIAYRVTGEASGRSIVYSGDTDMCDTLPQLARNADVLICESALPGAHKAPGHLTPEEAGRIAARAGVRQLVLTHLYPECETADMIGECRRRWDGPLLLAEDLMRLEPKG